MTIFVLLRFFPPPKKKKGRRINASRVESFYFDIYRGRSASLRFLSVRGFVQRLSGNGAFKREQMYLASDRCSVEAVREMAARRQRIRSWHTWRTTPRPRDSGCFERVEKHSSLDRYYRLSFFLCEIVYAHTYVGSCVHRVARVRGERISGLTKIKAGSAECEQGRSIDINQFRK